MSNRVRDNFVTKTASVGTATSGFISEYVYTSDGAARSAPSPLSFTHGPFPNSSEYQTGKEMSDILVPGFRQKVKSGTYVPTNPMASSGYEEIPVVRRTTIRRTVQRSGNFYRFTDRKFTASFLADQIVTSGSAPSTSPLIIDAQAKLKGGFMDVLTSASEFHKTVRMIVGFRRKLISAFEFIWRRFVRSGRWRKAHTYKQIMEAFASFWLEVRYGWRILLFEYNSIARYIDETRSGWHRRSFRSQKEVTGTFVHTQNPNYSTGDLFTVRREFQTMWLARGGVTGKVNLSYPGKLDPITTIWELIPFSFVVDMFTNMGSVLEAMSPFSTVEVEGGFTSVMRRCETHITCIPAPPPAGTTILWQQSDVPGFMIHEHYTRQPDSASFAPAFVGLPNWAQVTDLVSLTALLGPRIWDLIRRQGNR